MTIKTLYATASGITNIEKIRFSEFHNDSAPMVTVNCINTTLSIGDDIQIDLGYDSDHSVIFNGFVKDVTHSTPPTVYTITAYGSLIRAVDFFLAASNQNNVFTRTNIKAEDLVEDLLEEAGLTNYGHDATSFRFAVNGDLEINLVSIYDYCKMIADTLAWHLYGDKNGKIWFVERFPYVVSGDVSSYTINDSEIISLSYSQSERDLRNRIVVYGRDDISAEASASSPHLPTGFYKAVVVAADWIDSTSMAQLAADRNLEMLNRMTEEATVTMIGNINITARSVVTLVDSSTGLNDEFYVFGVDHTWGDSGFTSILTLRK